MKYFLPILAVLLVAGCSIDFETDQEIVDEGVKKCQEQGKDYHIVTERHGYVVGVLCLPQVTQ